VRRSVGRVGGLLGRMDRGGAGLRAVVPVEADGARGAAAEADRALAEGIDRGPLHGLPIGIKEGRRGGRRGGLPRGGVGCRHR